MKKKSSSTERNVFLPAYFDGFQTIVLWWGDQRTLTDSTNRTYSTVRLSMAAVDSAFNSCSTPHSAMRIGTH